MQFSKERSLSRRSFCLCCVGSAAYTATGGWLTPREAFAEARGLVSLFKDSAAVSPIETHKLRNNISVLEGSGGNIAVLTGSDGKVLIDGGIGVSRPEITKALADLGADPITHLVNTHWHFDHTSGNEWLHSAGAKIIAPENTRKYLSEVQRVEDWDYNFLPLPPGGIPSEVFAAEHSLKLNGATIGLKRYTPAHTDSDISVTFGEADILHAGDTYWNSIYPFIDYSTGGSIDGMIAASDANLAVTTNKTIIIPGHGHPVSNESSSKNSAICSSPSGKISLLSRKKEDRGMRSWRSSRPQPLMPNGAISLSTPAFSPDWFMRAFDHARRAAPWRRTFRLMGKWISLSGKEHRHVYTRKAPSHRHSSEAFGSEGGV